MGNHRNLVAPAEAAGKSQVQALPQLVAHGGLAPVRGKLGYHPANDGVGRTDLPGGDSSQLKESIKRLKGLEIEWLLPGHGDMVSGAKEVRANFDQLEHFYLSYV